MVANIINNEVEQEDFVACSKGEMMELDDKEEKKVPKTTYVEDTMTDSKEEEKCTKLMTPRS